MAFAVLVTRFPLSDIAKSDDSRGYPYPGKLVATMWTTNNTHNDPQIFKTRAFQHYVNFCSQTVANSAEMVYSVNMPTAKQKKRTLNKMYYQVVAPCVCVCLFCSFLSLHDN